MLQERIISHFQQMRGDMLRDLGRLVAIDSQRSLPLSGMPFGEGPAKALCECLVICQERGLETRNYENYAGTASYSHDEPYLDILCHMDVVGVSEGWDTPPYTATEKDGLVYGRGTDDDKGPAIAAIYAMSAVRRLGIPLKRNVRLILGCDEETGMEDLDYFFKQEQHAPLTFSPDGEFPVVNIEKGSIKPTFTMSFEPTDALPRVTAFDGGERINVVPGKAWASVAGLKPAQLRDALSSLPEGCRAEISDAENGAVITVKGVSAHASLPDEGCNAICALLELLSSLPLADCGSTRAIRALSRLMPYGDNGGRALGIAQRDELSGELTLAFSLLTLNDGGCHGQFDSRTPICANDENCYEPARRAFEAAGFVYECEVEPPHHTPADTPFIATLLKCYEQYTGLKGECLAIGGGTYVHHIPGGVAFGAGMPGFQSNMHGPNECLSIDNWLTAAAIFTQVIIDLCGEKNP